MFLNNARQVLTSCQDASVKLSKYIVSTIHRNPISMLSTEPEYKAIHTAGPLYSQHKSMYTQQITLLADAYRRAHEQVIIENAVRADGIRPDGAFGISLFLLQNSASDTAHDQVSMMI